MTTSDYLEQLQQDREDLIDNLETQGITGLTGDETFTELVPEVLNISGGGDYFVTTGVSNLKSAIVSVPSSLKLVGDCSNMFQGCSNLTTIPLIDTTEATSLFFGFNTCSSLTDIALINTSNVTNMAAAFLGCSSLETLPAFDTHNVTNFNALVSNCTALKNFPALNASSATNLANMFNACAELTDDSLNNIMQMCISATSFTGSKTLSTLGLQSDQRSRCTQLSNYQAFLNAGWSAN